jgi:mRNA-degrading endonuclease HigB of HigAB toxin-antitoxin module
MKNNNCQLTQEYKEHKIFLELDNYINFYDLLSYSTSSWFNRGTKKILNFDSDVIRSMKGTLESIKLILEYGKINDAFALTRKYYDITITNIYALLYLENNFSDKNLVVEKINNWLQNKDNYKLPSFGKMNQYITDSTQLKQLSITIDKSNYYSTMKQRLNDHTHYNYFTYMLYNDNEMFDMNNNRVKLLDQLEIDIQNIFIKHFILLFTIKDNYMMSSDYIDYLDMGEQPPENSQYWVATFIQKIFDDVIKKNRPDLVDVFKNSTAMELE